MQHSKEKIGILLFWLLIWQVAAGIVQKEILLVSPFGVCRAFLYLAGNMWFWQSVGVSLLRILAGFAGAFVLGGVTAVFTYCFPWAYRFLSPVIHIIGATPVASFIILALVWFRTTQIPVIISLLMVFPVVWNNIYSGLTSADRLLLEVAYVYRFSFWKQVQTIYLPALLPYLQAALLIGSGMAWKSGIAAEVLCTPKYSIGRQMYEAKVYLDTPALFAWTAVVILCSVALEKGLLFLINRGVREEKEEQ